MDGSKVANEQQLHQEKIRQKMRIIQRRLVVRQGGKQYNHGHHGRRFERLLSSNGLAVAATYDSDRYEKPNSVQQYYFSLVAHYDSVFIVQFTTLIVANVLSTIFAFFKCESVINRFQDQFSPRKENKLFGLLKLYTFRTLYTNTHTLTITRYIWAAIFKLCIFVENLSKFLN